MHLLHLLHIFTVYLCRMSYYCGFFLNTCVARLDCICSLHDCMVYLYVCMFINMLICIVLCTFLFMCICMLSVLLSCAPCPSVSLSACFSYFCCTFRKRSFGSSRILVLWLLYTGFFLPSLLSVSHFPWRGFPSLFCLLLPAEVLQVCLLLAAWRDLQRLR
jgi:hypothetical protein